MDTLGLSAFFNVVNQNFSEISDDAILWTNSKLKVYVIVACVLACVLFNRWEFFFDDSFREENPLMNCPHYTYRIEETYQ